MNRLGNFVRESSRLEPCDDRRPLVIVGAGGHAKVVVDIVRAANQFEVIGCTDSHAPEPNVLGAPVIGGDECLAELLASGVRWAFVALGSNRIRLKVGRALTDQGFELPTLVHPTATISSAATLGRGVVVMPGAVVNAGAVIGDFCILNTLASVDHDCVLEAGVHVAPRTALAGCVRLEEGVFFGVGAVAIPGVRIGRYTTVGAGGVVVKDLPPDVVAMGVPAQARRNPPR